MSAKEKKGLAVELRLPTSVAKTYEKIAAMADTDVETVIRVVLARDVVIALPPSR